MEWTQVGSRVDAGDATVEEMTTESRRRFRPALVRRRVHVMAARPDDVTAVTEALDHDGIEASVTVSRPGADTPAHGQARPDLLVLWSMEPGAPMRDLVRAYAPGATVAVAPEVTTTTARRFLEAGVEGVVAEGDVGRALGAVLAAALAGQICVPRHVRETVEPPALSRRERQVLALIAGGLSNQEIAQELFLSESTVKSHAASAFRRLGVRSRREAVAVVLGSNDTLRRSVLMSHPLDRGPRRAGLDR